MPIRVEISRIHYILPNSDVGRGLVLYVVEVADNECDQIGRHFTTLLKLRANLVVNSIGFFFVFSQFFKLPRNILTLVFMGCFTFVKTIEKVIRLCTVLIFFEW